MRQNTLSMVINFLSLQFSNHQTVTYCVARMLSSFSSFFACIYVSLFPHTNKIYRHLSFRYLIFFFIIHTSLFLSLFEELNTETIWVILTFFSL